METTKHDLTESDGAEVAEAHGVRLSVTIPREFAESLRQLAAQEDRSLSGQIAHIIRRHFDRAEDERRYNEYLLREAIAAADRGETMVLREGALEATRQALLEGKSPDEVMAEFTRGALPRAEWEAQRAQQAQQAGAEVAGNARDGDAR
jgi:hypothetical protein